MDTSDSQSDSPLNQSLPCTPSYASSSISSKLNDTTSSSFFPSIYNTNNNNISSNSSINAFNSGAEQSTTEYKYYRPIVSKKLHHSQSFSTPAFDANTVSQTSSNYTLHQIRNSLIDKITLNQYNQSNFQREQILKQIKSLELQLELQKQQDESVQRLQQSSYLFNQRIIQQQQLQQQLQQQQQLPQPVGRQLQQQQINRAFNPRKTLQLPKSSSSGNINCSPNTTNSFSMLNNDQLCRLLSQNLESNLIGQQLQQQTVGTASNKPALYQYQQYNFNPDQ